MVELEDFRAYRRIFGHIPGIRVLKTFPDRLACLTAGLHGQYQAGIHGHVTDGAYSVVLSGGYDEDEDRGDTFVYTGCGGNSKDTSWKHEQTAHQSFDNRFNKSLEVSSITKRPVRVIRGYFKDKKDRLYDSPYAPVEGYRYDGLYIVDRAYMKDGKTSMKDGKTKYQVCAFDFRRIEGQPPIPIRGGQAIAPSRH